MTPARSTRRLRVAIMSIAVFAAATAMPTTANAALNARLFFGGNSHIVPGGTAKVGVNVEAPSGSGTISAPTVTINVPNGLVVSSVKPLTSETCDTVGQQVTCSLGSMSAGAIRGVTVNVTASGLALGDSVDFDASLSAADDADPTDNIDTWSVAAVAIMPPDLVPAYHLTSGALPSANVRLGLGGVYGSLAGTVQNHGEGWVSNRALRVTYGEAVSVSATAGNGVTCTRPATRVIECDKPTALGSPFIFPGEPGYVEPVVCRSDGPYASQVLKLCLATFMVKGVAAGSTNVTIRAITGDDVTDADPGNDNIVIPVTVYGFLPVFGTTEANIMYGGAGQQRIYGRGGADKLFGQGGNDLLVGGPGKDLLDGGAGSDVLDARDLHSGDIVRCGPGSDIARVNRGDSADSSCEHVIHG